MRMMTVKWWSWWWLTATLPHLSQLHEEEKEEEAPREQKHQKVLAPTDWTEISSSLSDTPPPRGFMMREASHTHTHTPRGEEEEETGAKSGLQRLLLAGHRKYRPAGEPHTQSSLLVLCKYRYRYRYRYSQSTSTLLEYLHLCTCTPLQLLCCI